MEKINNILKYNFLSPLPRGRFYAGECPGAAAITFKFSLFSSLRGVPGFAGKSGSWKTEEGSFSGNLVSDSLFLISYSLFPCYENKEYRITNVESGSQEPEPGTRNPEPGTRNPKPGTRNPKPGTRNPEPETRNPKPGTRNPKPGTRNPEPGTRNPEPGTRNPEPGTRNPEPETRNTG
jgi:hypothetical protein